MEFAERFQDEDELLFGTQPELKIKESMKDEPLYALSSLELVASPADDGWPVKPIGGDRMALTKEPAKAYSISSHIRSTARVVLGVDATAYAYRRECADGVRKPGLLICT
jgi:hypothetical protein